MTALEGAALAIVPRAAGDMAEGAGIPLGHQCFADFILDARLREAFGKIVPLDDAKRLARLAPHDVVVLDERAIVIVVVLRHAEMVIEARLQRPVMGNWFQSALWPRCQFADGRRPVALRLEHRGDVHAVALDVVGVALSMQPPRITPRKQSIA